MDQSPPHLRSLITALLHDLVNSRERSEPIRHLVDPTKDPSTRKTSVTPNVFENLDTRVMAERFKHTI